MVEYVSGRLGLERPSGLSAAEVRLLPTMPLHAITSVYGEARLRQRLLIEIADLPAADRRRVDHACTLMSLLHAGDRRQREPYANHPLRVAIRILSHYRVRDAEVACAALLHDTVEDHAADITDAGTPDAALKVLARRFGARTAGLVAAVTNPTWEPGRDAGEQYREHVAASLEACPWSRVIKASDFTGRGSSRAADAGRISAGEIVGAAGNGRISAAPRQDYAAAAAALLEDQEGNRTYELGGPAFDLTELAGTITEVTGTRVTYRDLPAEGRMMTSLEDQMGLDNARSALLSGVPLGRYGPPPARPRPLPSC